MSDIGIEYSTPSSAKKRGSKTAKPTPNTNSRTQHHRKHGGEHYRIAHTLRGFFALAFAEM